MCLTLGRARWRGNGGKGRKPDVEEGGRRVHPNCNPHSLKEMRSPNCEEKKKPSEKSK